MLGARPGRSGLTSKPDSGQVTVVLRGGAFLTGSAFLTSFFAGAVLGSTFLAPFSGFLVGAAFFATCLATGAFLAGVALFATFDFGPDFGLAFGSDLGVAGGFAADPPFFPPLPAWPDLAGAVFRATLLEGPAFFGARSS